MKYSNEPYLIGSHCIPRKFQSWIRNNFLWIHLILLSFILTRSLNFVQGNEESSTIIIPFCNNTNNNNHAETGMILTLNESVIVNYCPVTVVDYVTQTDNSTTMNPDGGHNIGSNASPTPPCSIVTISEKKLDSIPSTTATKTLCSPISPNGNNNNNSSLQVITISSRSKISSSLKVINCTDNDSVTLPIMAIASVCAKSSGTTSNSIFSGDTTTNNSVVTSSLTSSVVSSPEPLSSSSISFSTNSSSIDSSTAASMNSSLSSVASYSKEIANQSLNIVTQCSQIYLSITITKCDDIAPITNSLTTEISSDHISSSSVSSLGPPSWNVTSISITIISTAFPDSIPNVPVSTDSINSLPQSDRSMPCSMESISDQHILALNQYPFASPSKQQQRQQQKSIMMDPYNDLCALFLASQPDTSDAWSTIGFWSHSTIPYLITINSLLCLLIPCMFI